VGVNNPGLSCVLVEGLLLLGYAYRVSALRAIPGAPLQAEYHLRVANNLTDESFGEHIGVL